MDPGSTPKNEASEKNPQGSPLFLKTFEMVVWVLEHTQKFSKSQRFVMAQRMEDAALSFQDEILWATKTSRKLEPLLRADYHLERLRLYNRSALKMRLHAPGQYEHLAKMLEEVGRLLGGWMRKVRSVPPRSGPRGRAEGEAR